MKLESLKGKIGCGYVSADRAIASNTRGPRFKASRRQNLY